MGRLRAWPRPSHHYDLRSDDDGGGAAIENIQGSLGEAAAHRVPTSPRTLALVLLQRTEELVNVVVQRFA